MEVAKSTVLPLLYLSDRETLGTQWKRASTSACCRSSASSCPLCPAASRRSIMLYYEEMPPRVRAVIGGAALVRAAAFC
eukprot:2502624-Prymnesium_polylepis.1